MRMDNVSLQRRLYFCLTILDGAARRTPNADIVFVYGVLVSASLSVHGDASKHCFFVCRSVCFYDGQYHDVQLCTMQCMSCLVACDCTMYMHVCTSSETA